MPEPAPDMLAAALDAYDAGLCVVRARADGSKRPMGEWKQYQAERPSREQVAEWFRDGHPAMGAICGAVSGGLEMFELEGRFVEHYGTTRFEEAMRDAGLELLFRRLLKGIITRSPSGGRHFLYRLSDGEVAGNSKIANDANSNTLIETRGEGGFVMLAPSHGATHPTGKPWEVSKGGFATIPTITSEEREALFAVARTFDETPPAPPPTPVAASSRTRMAAFRGGPIGESWIDAVEAHLEAQWDMQGLLEHYGWTYCYTDKLGRKLMHRPNKDIDGVGGSINLNDRFHPFSSSTPFPGASASRMAPTWDRADIIAIYEYGGDRTAALRAIADQTGIMGAWKAEKDAVFADQVDQLVTPRAEPEYEPPTLDKSTGEIEITGIEDLWEMRDVFRHIRDAARSRMVSPYAVLGAVLARVAAFTPPSTCLPPLVGGISPLSLYIALHGASGDGKSSPLDCAASLLPNIPPGCRTGPLGSGEGMIEMFLERTSEKDENGKAKPGYRQSHHGVLFALDEGELLNEIGGRKGSTILPMLRSAWSGGEIGQSNASADTKRHVAAKRYHIGLLSLWQDDAGVNLLGDAVGGTPQRFVWIPTSDRDLERVVIPWPGPLNWQPPPAYKIGDAWNHQPLDVPQEIQDIIRNHRWDVLQRVVTVNPLDAHRNLNQLRLAGVLAVLDGRRAITMDDWHIGSKLMFMSDAVRDSLLERKKIADAERVRVEAVKHAIRDSVVEKSAADRALSRAAKAAWRACEKRPDGAVKRDVHLAIASRDRATVSVDEAIEEAIRLRWITAKGDRWMVGEARPA